MAAHSNPLRKYLVEGSADGSLFGETVEARTMEEAESLAIDLLCEAWGDTRTADTTLDDLGDSAMVTEYSADMYARDMASEMLALIRDALPHVAGEVEQRKESGIGEYFADLEMIEQRMVALIQQASGPEETR